MSDGEKPSYLNSVDPLPDHLLAAMDGPGDLTPEQEAEAEAALKASTRQALIRRRKFEQEHGPVLDEPPVGLNPLLLEVLAGPLRKQ